MDLLRRRKEKKLEEYSKEDYRALAEAVVGGDLYYLKKYIAFLGDEDICIDLTKLERKIIDSMDNVKIDDAVDIVLWYLDDLEEQINYLNLQNKDEILKEIERIRETIESRHK